MMELFGRDGCVSCPATSLSCNCNSDETCTLVAQTCTACASILCEKITAKKLSHGAIAGVVIGSLCGAVLVVAIFCYFFIWRKRRNNAPFSPQTNSQMNEKAAGGWDRSSQSFPDANVIPIAYIPDQSHTKISLPGALPKSDDIRDSIAASNYRASIPNYVMAVQGQPSMVNVEQQALQEARARSLRLESISELTATPPSNSGNFSSPMPGNSDLESAFESSIIFNAHDNQSQSSRTFSGGAASIREISTRVAVNPARQQAPVLRSIHLENTESPSNTGSFRLSEFSFDTTEAHGASTRHLDRNGVQ